MVKEKESGWGLNPLTITAFATLVTAIIAVYLTFFQPAYVVQTVSNSNPCPSFISGSFSSSASVDFDVRNLGEKIVSVNAYVLSDHINFSGKNTQLVVVPGESTKFSFTGSIQNLSQPYPAHIQYIAGFECPNKDCKYNNVKVFECNYTRNESMESMGRGKPYYQLD